MSVRNNGTKLNIPMCIAFMLLCATLFSIHLTSGLYSRYVATDEGTDSARVIKFEDITLTETGDFVKDTNGDDVLRIAPGVDLEKQAKVSFNGSESATYVFVSITLGNDWISNTNNTHFALKSGDNELVSWDIENSWTYVEGSINSTESSTTYAYYKVLKPNTPLNDSPFFEVIDDGDTSTTDKNTIEVSESMTAAQLNDLTLPNIIIQATAVQSNGFNSVTDAWNAVKEK